MTARRLTLLLALATASAFALFHDAPYRWAALPPIALPLEGLATLGDLFSVEEPGPCTTEVVPDGAGNPE